MEMLWTEQLDESSGVCVYNWIGHAYGSSIMGFSMSWVSVGFVMGKHSAEINLTDDTRTYLNTVLAGSLSKPNFQPTSSQSYSLKYDLHNDVLLVMHNAFCVSSKRGMVKGNGVVYHLPSVDIRSALSSFSLHLFLFLLLCIFNVLPWFPPQYRLLLHVCFSPFRWPKQGRALSDAVTMTTSILSAPFWFRAPKTRFICKVGHP